MTDTVSFDDIHGSIIIRVQQTAQYVILFNYTIPVYTVDPVYNERGGAAKVFTKAECSLKPSIHYKRI